MKQKAKQKTQQKAQQTSQKKKQEPKRKNLLPLIAAVVVIAAAAVVLLPKLSGTGDAPVAASAENAAPADSADASVSVGSSAPADSGDLVIQEETIGTQASFFDYDAGGTTVEVFAVKASDGTIRLALNTCQVCNGSPYAYFEQDGDVFVCQNCQNRFASTQVGIVSGGCNPVPITDSVYTEQDGTITVPASFLEESASLFRNWKNF